MHDEKHSNQLPPELERYLALCEHLFEQMVETGEWPWTDSPDFEDVVDSKRSPTDI